MGGSSSSGDYEVFLSFRGADTRQGFTNVLYEYMSNAEIRVFRDDDALQIGDKIDLIFQAIANSKICIPILSPNFVQSRYCMLEVEKMVELKKTIVPIFYHVTSDDVKLKTPLYVNDFQKLEDKYGKHQVDNWKEALKEAVTYKGRKVGDKGYIQFCKAFVDEVLSKLGPMRELEIIDHSYGEANNNGESLDIIGGSSSQETVSDGIINDMGGIESSAATMAEGVPTANPIVGMTFGSGPVMVVGQEFVAPHPIDLIFRRTSMRSFDVIDPDGTTIFKFKVKRVWFTYTPVTAELLDPSSGNTLMTLYYKGLQRLFSMDVFRGKSTDKKDLLFNEKLDQDHFKKNDYKLFKINVFLGQNPNEDVWDYRIEGCWPESRVVIYAGNTNDIVAQIMQIMRKKSTFMTSLTEVGVTVYPNIDYAFIVALFVSSFNLFVL